MLRNYIFVILYYDFLMMEKSPIQAFGQIIIQVVTEEEQWWQVLCPLLNLVLSY